MKTELHLRVRPEPREGICGDEAPSFLGGEETMSSICELRHGHESDWHEDETGKRWKYRTKPRELVLGPDDQLIVSLPIGATRAEVDRLAELLGRRFPDRVTVVAGIEQIAVVKNSALPATPIPVERGQGSAAPPG